METQPSQTLRSWAGDSQGSHLNLSQTEERKGKSSVSSAPSAPALKLTFGSSLSLSLTKKTKHLNCVDHLRGLFEGGCDFILFGVYCYGEDAHRLK